MATTYQFLASSTVGSGGTASITFSSISDAYTDLVLLLSGRDGRASYADDFKITINANTSATYSNKRIYVSGASSGGDGGSATGLTYAYSGFGTGASSGAGIFGIGKYYFTNYRSATDKSWYVASGAPNDTAANYQNGLHTNRTNDSNPITSIKIEGYNSGSLPQYVSAYLYGIKKS